MIPINILSVVIASVVAFVLGFLFHGPVSGKLWMKLANIVPTGNEKFKDIIPQMIWNLVANFVTAMVIAVVYLFASTSPYLGHVGVLGGIIVALWLWLGFCVAGSSPEVIWMGKKFSLWFFEVVCSFVIMIAMGAIIGSSFASKNIDVPVTGKIDPRVACESALAYTSFMNGAESQKFVDDCVDGKYPEVIQRYISDMGWSNEAI